MKIAIAITFLALAYADPSKAAVDATAESPQEPAECHLNAERTADRDKRLARLSQRFFLASMEVMEDPDQFERVKREVRAELREMRKEFGGDCLKDLI